MALRRGGGQRFNPIIWPGFVDAMTGLLLVLMFVLTIFTVVQFVLRDTITGQQHELSDLTGEVAELASALGFERDRSATLAQQIGSLSQSLSLSNNEAEAQAVMILSLTSERNVQAEALSTAQSRITGFEAQIAGLMQQRSSAQDMIASLEADSAAATAQIAGLQDSAAASALRIASLRDAGTAADARIAGLEADGASATAQIAGLQADSAAATARIAGLEDDVTAATTRISNLETDSARATETIAALEADSTAAAAREAELQVEARGTAATLADLEAVQARLITEQEAMQLALARARNEMDAGVEEARLAAARRDALAALIDDLKATNDAAISRISMLQGAAGDATARVTSLEAAQNRAAQELTEAEAARLVEAAAAQALRDRLANAGAELTAMSLNLEEQRRQAENTLTLLAAAEAARDDLDMRLAEAILVRQQIQNAMTRSLQTGNDLDARLLAALTLQTTTDAELARMQAEMEAAGAQNFDLTTRLAAAIAARALAAGDLVAAEAALRTALSDGELAMADIEEQLAAVLLERQAAEVALDTAQTVAASHADAQEDVRAAIEARLRVALLAGNTLQAEVNALSQTSSASELEQADLEAQLARAVAQLSSAEGDVALQLSAAQRQAALAHQANEALLSEEALSAESRREVAALTASVSTLRNQLRQLQASLELADAQDLSSDTQIEALGQQLNTALARAATEARRREALEVIERQRLEAEAIRLEAEIARQAEEAQSLESYKSEFFGRMREVLANEASVRIDGDRFVFSSEVLFQQGRAALSAEGRAEISKISQILDRISGEIPEGIDWVIRVDGHTDNVPLSGNGEFANNWELSQARALSVVLFMIEQEGIDPAHLAANGFGEFQPLNTEDSDFARAQNRRIELKLTER